MKWILAIILLISFSAQSQVKKDSISEYEVDGKCYHIEYIWEEPKMGWIIGFDSLSNYGYIQKIFYIDVMEDKEVPCPNSDSTNGVFTSCGTIGFYKMEYYKPKKGKESNIGERYYLKSNEHFAIKREWFPNPIVIISG